MTGTPDRLADYTVKIAFGANLGNRLHFSSSDPFFSLTQPVFMTDWAASFGGQFDDVSLDIAEGSTVTISRGSDAKLASIESGKATFQILNATTPNLYDPNDPTSPLVNGVEAPGLVPMRPVQIQGTPYVLGTGGSPLGLFYGFLRTASFDPDTKVCTVSCEDLIYWLGRLNAPVIAEQTGISSSAAVQLLLNAIGWSDPSLQVLEASPAIRSMTFSSDGSQTALELLQGILDAEQGYVFVDGNGAFHFEGRYARDGRKTATASFDESALIGLSSDLDADNIINQATVTCDAPNGTGTPQIANDTSSQTQYGVSSGASIDTAYLSGDPEAKDLANLLLQRLKDSHPPQQATIDNSTATLLGAQMVLNPQDRVAVSGVDCFVESLEHEIKAGGLYHSTTLLVTKAPAGSVFEFGVSTFGSSDYFG